MRVNAAQVIRSARTRAGLTLRELAAQAGTSHSAIAAYESGAKSPSASTVDRIVEAAGFALDRELSPRVRDDGRQGRGAELAAVLELAAEFPARHASMLEFPVFGR
ncbi:helix-turn-helix domain-containing protein [Candidatus Poriferisodalis sp.]|uniref:helix-turn-helix domain-containing protein n=1 Tax=Candidatus Poriferisodalis sp. TaxID=3101277 RepID=UPI003B02BB09